jgi:hypothetical protein
MPDRDVTTIKDLIHYRYPKANHYGFIKQTFRELQNKLFTKG